MGGKTPVALEIFGVACKAVLKVFLIAAVGCWARRRGLLDAQTAKVMSKVNGTVFLPCLLFVALAKSVTIEHLRNVWLLPLAAVSNIVMGAAMGVVLLKTLRVPNGFRGPAVAASAFGNSLALPVVLISAIIGSGKVGHLTFTEEDEGAALLYLGAYMTTLTILMWSVGPSMMHAENVAGAGATMTTTTGGGGGPRAYEDIDGGRVRGGHAGDGVGGGGGEGEGAVGGWGRSSTSRDGGGSTGYTMGKQSGGGDDVEIEMTPGGGGGAAAGGNAEGGKRGGDPPVGTVGDGSTSDEEEEEAVVERDGDEELLTVREEDVTESGGPASRRRSDGGGGGGGGGKRRRSFQGPAAAAKHHASTTTKKQQQSPPLHRRVATLLAPAANNNVLASLLGIVVGISPPLRSALFDRSGALFVFADAASVIADAAIPQVIVILGASLANGPDHSLCDRRTALSIAMVRLAFMPLLNILVFLALKATLPPAATPSSPAFWLVFLIEGAMPTANNMMLQVQMYGSQAAAGGIGACLFWQYVVAPVLLTGSISLFLVLIG